MVLLLLRVALVSLACCAFALSDTIPTEPILRIEPGMHMGRIVQIAVDRAEKIVVTGSDDRTVRVWDLHSGRLLEVLRPPIGEGNEGRINAVAVSPDGQTILAGGWTGAWGSKSAVVYLFDRASGQIRARITGVPNVIHYLSYSPDGNWLAVCFGGSEIANGIRLYRARDFSLAIEDRNYANSIRGADFSPDSSRLITSSSDGFLRLYDVASGRLLLTRKAPTGQLYQIHFSPDGSRIAVAYYDVPRVSIFSAANLSIQSANELRAQSDTGFLDAAWSQDGRYLYAAGRYENANGITLINRWPAQGLGPGYSFGVAFNTVTSMLALRGGRVLYASTEPRWGVTDAAGKSVVAVARNSADFIKINNALNASSDGLEIAFPYDPTNQIHAVFSISERSFLPNQLERTLSAPIESGINVTEWHNYTTPKFNGSLIKLENNEISRALAIAPDQSSFVLGTDRYLRLFDRRGALKWQIAASGSVRAVNIPQRAAVVIAASLDGTIRWYRLSDGKELLAFFSSADLRRWVLWTPEGYYDASPGGDSLIGWHVNRGPAEVADFFPVSHFRATYYKPELIASVLSPGVRMASVPTVARTIAKSLPPVVKILSPQDGSSISSTDFPIKYSAASPGGEPITAVHVLLDGRPLPGTRGTESVLRGNQGERGVRIDEKDTVLSVIAENRYGSSEPATVHLRWAGTQPFTFKPKLYIVAIGISAYPPEYELPMAARDAQNFVTALAPQKNVLYSDIQTKVLTDKEATRNNILDDLEWLEHSTTQHDVAMLFVAGHGEDDPNRNYYFLPVDFDPNRLKSTGIEFSQFTKTVQNLSGKVLFFLDTCHAGDVMGPRTRGGPADINAVISELSSAENGVVVFAASTGKQVALENKDWGDGAFTKALVEGLKGKADVQHSGRITINMLDYYISERVKDLTGGKQTPTTSKPETISDFPIALVR